MSLAQTRDRLQLPESLQEQLRDFRRRVWSIKMLEAACAAVFGVVAAFLVMFALDRVWDTPSWPRITLFVAALAGCAIVPLALHRWVWNHRRLDQLARLLGHKLPHLGDQLLGVIELVASDSEQARSRTLCEAAVRQVAEETSHRDLKAAAPTPRHRVWAWMVAVPAAVTLALFVGCPAAASNAWARLVAPWKNTPRYTFAAIESLPTKLVVAHGEAFTVTAKLADGTVWRPKQGVVQFGKRRPVTATLRKDHYEFALPSQIDSGWLDVRIGDFVQRLRIEPTLRPELSSVLAAVKLPAYLGLPAAQKKDVRGGTVSLVKGSRAQFSATASRVLSEAKIDGKAQTPYGATISTTDGTVDESRKLEFRWRDKFGLAGKEPFTLSITARDDEAPSLACEDLPRQKVVLDSEQLTFKVRAQDDFGVKRVGLEWEGLEDPVVKTPAKGERVLAAGKHDKETMELTGTFTAKAEGIEPQPISLRVYVEDYLPGRPRVYSPTYTLYVLNPEQHAIWLTEQLSKWHRQALEVRDREMQLLETNKQLRALSTEELDRPDTRKRIESQATAERANGRRLSNLVENGGELVQAAMRNPEFGVGHLEKWAEMLRILKDISGNRMPSVADLLKQAAQAPTTANAVNPQSNRARMVGQNRSGVPNKPGDPAEPAKKKNGPAVPLIVDRESQHQAPGKTKEEPDDKTKKKPSSPALRLPTTSLAGKPGKSNPNAPKADEAVEEAVVKQEDLLAEFEKIADELNRVLAQLEGSTLVKRLKAASRLQYNVAGRISDSLTDTFGAQPSQVKNDSKKLLTEMAEQESKGSHNVSLIMDDMQAYFERRQYVQFKTVLDDMRKQDVIGSLRLLSDDLRKENGVSIAQAEYWSDCLDRWAEDLVDPTACGKCPGGKSRSSLPPSIVLEVLQILESEVNLREDTRVAQQARPALETSEFEKQGKRLSGVQDGLRDRVDKVTERIRELKDGEQEFAKEIALLRQVSSVMSEATEILARPETGSPAIAAETEAIELLLQSRRFNPKGGGGGGGANPGGGGTGTTLDSALALLGKGTNEKEVREDHGVSQASGESGPVLPEEFRAGLDEYFNRLEKSPGTR
jgi:hypothetical protein